MRIHPVRPGYTLLEVIVAIAIGLLLVAALYVALDVQFRYMQSGRDAVAEGQLARGLLNRITSDIRSSLASLTTVQAAGSGAGSQTAETGGSQANATGEGEAESDAVGTGQVNLGIIGDEFQMMLFTSALPRYGRQDADLETWISDLRRITYYLVPGEGLARQEVRRVTGDPNSEDEPPVIVGQEVVELRFRYFDPGLGDWVTTWDGTTTGPPLAIEITMGIEPPRESHLSTPKPPNYYRVVVAVPAANISQEQVNGQTGGVR